MKGSEIRGLRRPRIPLRSMRATSNNRRCIFVERPHGLSFTLPLVGRVDRRSEAQAIGVGVGVNV